ncbi:MAG: NADH-quinone oxidoreductase subunit N, partial [Elusimicrobia bacterium]|nr:NADH-quinone oxidoreductase subunit N [Elusimicrobiota bacterium]
AALGAIAWGLGRGAWGMGALWVVDPLSQFFKVAILLCVIMVVMLALEYRELPPAHAGTFAALLLFSAAGMMFLVSACDLLLIFLALELVSICSFALTGFERRNLKSNEGAVKYFLFGAFSSAIMVYGISLYYGAAGTTRLVQFASGPHGGVPWPAGLTAAQHGPVFLLAMLLILLGFGFKAAMAPMHFWVPDAYEGAPLPVTAYLSVAPKIAAMGVLLRVFALAVPAAQLQLTTLLALLAILTMTVGNTVALFQFNVKRLLAYSSVAQAGYILIGLAVGGEMGIEGVLLYCAVYLAMNLGAFAVVQAVGDDGSHGGLGSYELSAFDGLARRNLPLSLLMTLFLLSLAGIPPLAGFIGKFYLFASAMDAGRLAASGTGPGPGLFYALAIAGVVNSVISVYYYMKIAFHMFFLPPQAPEGAAPAAVTPGPFVWGCLAVALAGVLAFGLFPEPLIAQVKASALHLP